MQKTGGRVGEANELSSFHNTVSGNTPFTLSHITHLYLDTKVQVCQKFAQSLKHLVLLRPFPRDNDESFAMVFGVEKMPVYLSFPSSLVSRGSWKMMKSLFTQMS